MMTKYIYQFRNAPIFVFRSAEGSGEHEIVDQIRSTEAKIQKEKQGRQQVSLPEDIVDESKVDAAIKAIQERIDKSPVVDKRRLKKALSVLLDERKKEIAEIDANEEAEFREVFERTLKDLDEFDQRDGVKEARGALGREQREDLASKSEKVRVLDAKIDKEKERIEKAQTEHFKASDQLDNYYRGLGLGQHLSPRIYAGILERYAVSNKNLIDSLGGLMVVQQKFAGTDEGRQAIFRERLALKMKFYVAIFSPKEQEAFPSFDVSMLTGEPKQKKAEDLSPMKVTVRELQLPVSLAEYKALQKRTNEVFSSVMSSLYIETGDEKYKKYFDERQEKLTQGMKKDAVGMVDEAWEEDGKGRGMMEMDPEAVNAVSLFADQTALHFAEIKKLQIQNPFEAYTNACKFINNLGEEQARLEPLLKSYPALRTTFLDIVSVYKKQAEEFAADALTRNPILCEFKHDLYVLMKETEPFLKSITALMELVEKGETPSVDFMEKWVYPAAEFVNSHPLIEKLLKSPAVSLLQGLKTNYGGDPNVLSVASLFGKDFSFGKMGLGISGAFGNLERDIWQSLQYCQTLKETAEVAVSIKGMRSGAGGFTIDALIIVGKTLVAVAGAVAMTIALPVSGPIGVAVVTGFGAAFGNAFGGVAFEGDYSGFDPETFMRNWATGALFTYGAGVVGRAAGSLGGDVAANVASRNSVWLQRAQEYAKKYAERSALPLAAGGGFKGLLQRIAEETREELMEDTLQAFGRAVAPEHPWLGFALSLIPSATSAGRGRFVASIGKFSPQAGIEGQVTDSGVELTYDPHDPIAVRAFLEQRGAPAEVLQQFDITGQVDMDQEGVNVTVKPALEGLSLEVESEVSDDLRREYRKVYEETNDEVLFTVLHKEITGGEITPQALIALHKLFHPGENDWRLPEGLDPLQAHELLAQKIAEVSGLSVERARQLIPMVQGGYFADVFHAFWGKWFGLEPDADSGTLKSNSAPEAQAALVRRFEAGDFVSVIGKDGVRDRGWMVLDQQPAPGKYTLVKMGPDNRTKVQMEITEEDLLSWNPEGPIKIMGNSDQIIQDAFRKSPQFALTHQLIRGGMFKIQGTINIGGAKFHVSPIMRVPDGRLCCVMMVDFGDGKLFPRIIYKSHSEGGWRSPRGTKDQADKQGRVSPVYKKGFFKEAYTHETKVATEIADYLDESEEAFAIVNIGFNPMETYFHENNPSLAETDTYGRDATDPYAEVRVVPESNLFWRFRERGYQPGGLTATDASSHFRSLDKHYPPGFIPDFSRGPIKQPVKRTHDLFGKIIVETYRGYLNGRAVNWEIAREDIANANYQGRVWIEGIRFSPPLINSYGTSVEILLTGVLSHKPAEYNDYTTGLKYGSERVALNPHYDDITPLLDNLRPIREFRQARGIYRVLPRQQQQAAK